MTITEQPCWICKSPANSAEHRLKKTDLVRTYGTGPFTGPNAPVHVRGGVLSPIQGPRSRKLKYEQSLCHACNTTRTQPFDIAYDHFIDWVMDNEVSALRKRLLDFEEIYGQGWQESQLNLFKYCIKSFGCRLVDAGQTVPEDLIDLLPLDRFLTGLKITFSVNEDILLFDGIDRAGFIGKGDLLKWASKQDRSIVNGYEWNEHISWFAIHYWYGVDPRGSCGSTWIGNSRYVYLGTTAPLTPEERAEFLRKKESRRAE